MPLAKKSLKNLASHQTQIAFEGYVMETYYLKLGFDSVNPLLDKKDRIYQKMFFKSYKTHLAKLS
jgi:hypothetical protein